MPDFGILLETALSNQIDVALLNRWYRRDDNAVPPVFQLQPITVRFPNYNSRDSALRQKDREDWWQTFTLLQQLFWKLAKVAVRGGAMSPDHAHKYFMSGEMHVYDLCILFILFFSLNATLLITGHTCMKLTALHCLIVYN